MKKYLREIEMAGMLLLAIGVIMALAVGTRYGMWPCAVGLLLWITTMLYKAFHWQAYERENKRNIIIILMTIVILFIQMISRQ